MVLTGAARERAINAAGLIHKDVAIIVSWLMVGIAISMIILRLVVRLRQRRQLFLDDYLVLISVVMMIAAAGIFHAVTDGLYLYRSFTKPNPQVTLNFNDLEILWPVSSYTLAFVMTSWTSIFCVKFSFLALFHTLMRNLSERLTKYFWGVVAFTILTWAFLLTESPILCSHFGKESLKCNENGIKWTVLTALVTFLDVSTDLMIVSFPILILRKSLMDARQKFWIKFFLSLSVFMIIIALVRVLGGIRPGESQLDATWQLFWQLLEACTAVIAASATTMRSAFIRKEPHEYTPEPVARPRFFQKGFSLLVPTFNSEKSDKQSPLQIPTNVVNRDKITMSGFTKSFSSDWSSSDDRSRV